MVKVAMFVVVVVVGVSLGVVDVEGSGVSSSILVRMVSVMVVV